MTSGVFRFLWLGHSRLGSIPVQEVCPSVVFNTSFQRQDCVRPHDRPVISGPLEAHADETAAGAFHHARSNVHAPLQVATVLYAVNVRLHIFDAFRHIFMLGCIGPKVGDNRRGRLTFSLALFLSKRRLRSAPSE